jgi:hypothetical protein|tara:strand:+ start:1319 stop:1693 length:375 start_codon:yes stop_codon:yes gene_type:complete
MNFFQLQNKLFYSKKENAGELDSEGEQSFVPFLFNRWLSFYSKELPGFVNETLNKFGNIFDDKQESYKLYYYLIPRLKWKKISYIKKKKKDKEEIEGLNNIAKNKNISARELLEYVELEKKLRK